MAKDNEVISFAKEVKKRTGVDLDEDRIAQGVPQRVPVDPQEDRVVRLAMDLLSVVRRSDASSNPVAVIAALQVVGNTLSQEFVRALGQEQAQKAAAAATTTSRRAKRPNGPRLSVASGMASPRNCPILPTPSTAVARDFRKRKPLCGRWLGGRISEHRLEPARSRC